MALLDELGHDVFRNRVGLGKPAQLIYFNIVLQPGSSLHDLAARTGLSSSVLRGALRRLADHGLAWCDDDGHWITTGADLNAVASEIGAAGRGERQRDLHKRQRDARDMPREVPGWYRAS